MTLATAIGVYFAPRGTIYPLGFGVRAGGGDLHAGPGLKVTVLLPVT
ncbi:MAG TPA: hypothetical protein VF489_06460 [Sphingobium sp.]